MPPSKVQWLADITGVPSKDLAKSAIAFMEGILGCALDLAMHAFKDTPLFQRLYTQLELVASCIVTRHMGIALDVNKRIMSLPSDGVCWDDVAPAVKGCHLVRGDGGSRSVGPRFILPAVCAYFVRSGDNRALEAARFLEKEYGKWKNELECWPVGSVFGWNFESAAI